MMRKMFSAVLVFGLVFTMFLATSVCPGNGLNDIKDEKKDLVYGNVYYSADGLAKIFENETWVCKNITAYCIDEYENGTVDLAIGNETNDLGESHVSNGYDYFRFNPYEKGWNNYSLNQEHIAVGETTVDGKDYVFITTFIYKTIDGNRRGLCEWTEWEPIPTPIVYAKGDGWINISIPKFTNPVLVSYGSSGTPNMNNTTGFAVYRNGTEYIGNTSCYNETHYFYNDTVSSGVVYHYSVAPIAKGNYTPYGKSLLASSEELSVTLNSPITGNEVWAGGSTHDISYTITGGSPPYNVVMSYSTGLGYTTIDEIIHNEEVTYTYEWSVPKINCSMMRVRVNVTDYALSTNSKISDTFTIDSTAPIIESTIPPADGSVSISKPITIVFSEKMNQTATVSAFSISPNPGGWAWTWNDAGDTMRGTHNDFVFGTTYTATISTAAKDLAGNYLVVDYFWNFTANMSVSINSPNYGDVWTGGVEHGINYTISGGTPSYEVKIYYSNGGNWSLIAFDNRTEEGTYEYPWASPSIDSKTVNVKIVVVDGNDTESNDISGNFEIDSTAPTIVDYSGSAGVMLTTESVMIVFSEEMNTASTESASILEDSDGNLVNGTFSWDENVMNFTPDAGLASGADYTATINITAKDKSDPGNSLTQTYSWSFTAVQGRGDLIISLSISPSPEKGKTSTVTVSVSNTGPGAENLSGFLTVKFYESPDGETWTPIATKYIQNIWVGNSSPASTTFTFDDYGKYYFLVEVTSNNPTDTFPGGEKTGRASASCNILKPSEEIGAGPYTLIALMVVIVIIVAALILLSLKKKGELTLKEKTKEEKEEEEREEEESEEEEEKG